MSQKDYMRDYMKTKGKATRNKAVAKWKDTHREEYNAYMREYMKQRRLKNALCS